MKLKITNLLFLGLILSLTAFASQTIKDALGNPYTPSFPPQRIVSLAPNITEILFALDLGEKIVGVTRFCDYPQEALTKEKIGGMIDPNLEKIKSLNPDLVIGFRGNPIKTIERLKKLKLPVFVLEMGPNVESVFTVIETVGKITKRDKESTALVGSMKSIYSRIQSTLCSINQKPKVFLLLHGTGLWTCGGHSFLNDLLTKAKGLNIAGNIPRRWLNYNLEQLVHQNPDIIVILAKSKENFHKTKERLKRSSPYKGIRAVEEDRIYFLDENIAARPGPRLLEALSQLAHTFHPGKFRQEK